eukprot:GEMP01097275.1.p1 GENE.GEMP01097275.1~~GEMP01097275.1.p1  ORF type:complete len:152 (+),score=34.32 GEMP01097275.1:164-619(+)
MDVTMEDGMATAQRPPQHTEFPPAAPTAQTSNENDEEMGVPSRTTKSNAGEGLPRQISSSSRIRRIVKSMLRRRRRPQREKYESQPAEFGSSSRLVRGAPANDELDEESDEAAPAGEHTPDHDPELGLNSTGIASNALDLQCAWASVTQCT